MTNDVFLNNTVTQMTYYKIRGINSFSINAKIGNWMDCSASLSALMTSHGVRTQGSYLSADPCCNLRA